MSLVRTVVFAKPIFYSTKEANKGNFSDEEFHKACVSSSKIVSSVVGVGRKETIDVF